MRTGSKLSLASPRELRTGVVFNICEPAWLRTRSELTFASSRELRTGVVFNICEPARLRTGVVFCSCKVFGLLSEEGGYCFAVFFQLPAEGFG